MFRLSIWSQYYHELTPEEVVKRFIQNGIYCSELSDEHGRILLERASDYKKTGREFKEFLKIHNFEISQGHLWLAIKICSDKTAVDKLFAWIDMYEEIGIKNMVLHCDQLVESGLSKNERVNENISALKRIAEYIRNKEITICLENLRKKTEEQPELVDRNIDDLLYIIEKVGSDKFGVCLDTGHLNLTDKNHEEFILKAGDKLKALHIADNEGKTDQHMMPFTRGTVDFVTVAKALKKIGYNGLFNLEIPGETQIPVELRDAKIKYIKAVFEYLVK